MNHLLNLIKKELKELLTPTTVISMIVIAVLFASLGGLIGSETEKLTAPPTIGILAHDEADCGDALAYIDDFYTKFYGVADTGPYVISAFDPSLYDVFVGTPMNAAAVADAMNGLGVAVLLVFDKEYSNNIERTANGDPDAERGTIAVFWNGVDTGMFGSVSTAVIEMMISHINSETAKELIENGIASGDPDLIYSPMGTSGNITIFNGRSYGYSPAEISSALQSQSFLMPMMIMIIIAMIGGMIISSMGNEKENKTLETLLTLPVKRTTIVSGKLIGSAIAGLVFGIVYMTGMYIYTNSMFSSGELTLDSLGLTLSPVDWIIVAAMVFLAIMSALGICMILGAFVKNYKAAQTLTLPISVFAMIPMFVIMFSDFNALPPMLQVAIFAIPFSHPMMIMNDLMLGNTFMIWAGLGYLITFAMLMIFITVKIYNSDILLTGLVKKKNSKKNILSIFAKNKN
jgi:ABC-2 type transport system permease protein